MKNRNAANNNIPTGQYWINQIFEASAAKNSNVVRRKKADVEKFASIDMLVDEVRRRGFHLITSGDQFIIICNAGGIEIVA